MEDVQAMKDAIGIDDGEVEKFPEEDDGAAAPIQEEDTVLAEEKPPGVVESQPETSWVEAEV